MIKHVVELTETEILRILIALIRQGEVIAQRGGTQEAAEYRSLANRLEEQEKQDVKTYLAENKHRMRTLTGE